MGWSAYEVFTVISGIILIGWAAVDDGGEDEEITPAMRAGGAVSGVVFIGYAIYVANQTSGVWTFPILIFAIPVLALYRIGARLVERSDGGASPLRSQAAASEERAPHGLLTRADEAASDASSVDLPVDTRLGPDSNAEPETEHGVEDEILDDPAIAIDDDLTVDDPALLRRAVADARETTSSAPAAGWYADPGGTSDLRWWDGSAWTDAVRARA